MLGPCRADADQGPVEAVPATDESPVHKSWIVQYLYNSNFLATARDKRNDRQRVDRPQMWPRYVPSLR